MSTNAYTLTIKIDEWPTRDDLQRFLRASNAKEEIHNFLTQEFDTTISFKIGEVDLLANYQEAFILPLHAFFATLSSGLKQLAKEQKSVVPIYLQQYAVSEGSPAHILNWRLEGTFLYFQFVWGGEVETPKHIANLGEVKINFANMQKELIRVINEYSHTITYLLGHLKDWDGSDISALFANF